MQKGIVIDTNSSKKLYDKQDIFTTSSQLIRVNMVKPIFHFGTFVVFYVSSDTHRRLKTLQSNFRALKIKKTGNRYNESHCKQQVQEIFEGLKYLTTSEVSNHRSQISM